jgi:hypothetical protein
MTKDLTTTDHEVRGLTILGPEGLSMTHWTG